MHLNLTVSSNYHIVEVEANVFTNPILLERPLAKCSVCDRETTHYNVIISPTDSAETICWTCLMREEKGFNARKGFRRMARRGVIPR